MAETKYEGKIQLTGTNYLEMIDETIRLDIPILMVGSSSIGKSYSLTAIATSYGMEGEFLFIGSEKSEYIEGIPNLKTSNVEKESKKLSKAEQKSGVSSSDEYKFTYLKPFWFPDYLQIKERLANGRDAFKKNNPKLYKNLDDYDVLTTYKSTLNQTEASMKDNADELYYISMLQGYGNYWLMLDEIDKVEEHDKDKFAPLLHIVRERQLKGWSMKGIDKFNEIKYVPSIKERQSRVNYAIDGMDKDGKPIPKGVDNITDVRVIAIANVSAKITEGALVRRFVHFMVNKTLFTKSPMDKSGSWSDEDQERARKFTFHSCLVESKVAGSNKTIGDQMAELYADDLSEKLNELNLQWSLGFIPDFMFPMYMKDQKPPDVVRNLFVDSINSKTDKTKTETFMKKILLDNFTNELANTVNKCIVDQFTGKEVSIDKVRETAINLLSSINPSDYTSAKALAKTLPNVLSEYKKAGVTLSSKLGKKFHAQADDSQDSGDTFLATESEYASIENWIKIGTKCVEISLHNGRETALTNALVIALPLIQKQVVAASPYIMSLEEGGERFGFLKAEQSRMGITLLKAITNLTSLESPADKKVAITAGKEWAKDKVDGIHPGWLWDDIIITYGYNLDDKNVAGLKKYHDLEDKGKGMSKEAQKIIVDVYQDSGLNDKSLGCPVLIPTILTEVAIEHPDAAEVYLSQTADYLLYMKEIYGNLLEIISYYVGKDDIDGLWWYVAKFPYRFKVFHDDPKLGPKLFGNLYDGIDEHYNEFKYGVGFDKILND